MTDIHRGINEAFLLPQGEGQDEGILSDCLPVIDPLTPTLSRRERGYLFDL
jgi:hypothetical protein